MPKFIIPAGILVSTTIGGGVFALPYVFEVAGFSLGAFLLVSISILIAFTHKWLWQLFEKQNGKGFMDLVRLSFGKGWERAMWIPLIGGLMLALVAYISLGSTFLSFFDLPLFGFDEAFLFWFVCMLGLGFSKKNFGYAEFFGLGAMLFIISGIILFPPQLKTITFPPSNFQNILFPLGSLFFALSGWTAVRAMREWSPSLKQKDQIRSLWLASAIIIFFYGAFILTIWRSADVVSPDTISGLLSWGGEYLGLLGLLGLFAIWTSYVPIAREAFEELSEATKAPLGSQVIISLVPLGLFYLGLNSFGAITGFAGGVFTALQYGAIALLAKKNLSLKKGESLMVYLVLVVAGLALLYEARVFGVWLGA